MGKILRDFSLGLIMGRFYVTSAMIYNIIIIMGGFYVICKVFPVFTLILLLYMGRFYVRSKFLRKIFPGNTDLPTQ